MTASYPAGADPVSAGTVAGGTTISHAREHGRTLKIWENVLAWGARNDATKSTSSADSAAKVQDAVDAVDAAGNGGIVYMPAGKYYFSTPVTIPSGVHVVGAGGRNGATLIYTSNTYAFVAVSDASGFSITGVGWETILAGDTTSGAVKLVKNSTVTLRDIGAQSWINMVTPAIHLNGAINVDLYDVFVGDCGTHGIQIETNSWFANLISLYRCKVTSNNTTLSAKAGVHLYYTRRVALRDCHIESNKGYGVWMEGGDLNLVDGCWFESNSKHNVYISDDGSSQAFAHHVTNNHLFYNAGDDATAQMVKVTTGGVGTQSHNHLIMGNNMPDTSSSGISISIGANVMNSTIAFNRGVANFKGGVEITDSGTGTTIINNGGATTGPDDFQFPLSTLSTQGRLKVGSKGPLKLLGDTQTGDDTDLFTSGLFLVSDTLGEDYMGVTRTGHTVVRTTNGDPSTGHQPSSSFIPYWDQASSTVKVRVRSSGGSYALYTMAAAPSSAYTVTNPATDRGLNVSGDTTAQVAAVLGTLIADLQTAGILA